MDIDHILDSIYPLPLASKLLLKSSITERAYPKSHRLLRADKVETSIFFVKKGIARLYVDLPAQQVTFLFCKEGDTILSMKSYVSDHKGYENVELLEDCQVYELKKPSLQILFDEDIHIANWGRKFAESELIKTEERLISRQFRSATERYIDLLTDSPHLIQRVQLGHIASYLGITQVSLSRIRAAIK